MNEAAFMVARHEREAGPTAGRPVRFDWRNPVADQGGYGCSTGWYVRSTSRQPG